jgi:transcriptional regulator with XRE-family HTH domain
MPEAVTLGQYIAARRRTLRLKQEEVTERLREYGVDRATSTLANWEADRQSVPVDLLPALAGALEVSVVMLYERAGILAHLPGSEIVKLLDGKPPEVAERVARMIAAYFEDS